MVNGISAAGISIYSQHGDKTRISPVVQQQRGQSLVDFCFLACLMMAGSDGNLRKDHFLRWLSGGGCGRRRPQTMSTG